MKAIKSRIMRWAGNVARMGAEKNAYSISVGKFEGKRSLGTSRSRRKTTSLPHFNPLKAKRVFLYKDSVSTALQTLST
jgi:hypothetical protein